MSGAGNGGGNAREIPGGSFESTRAGRVRARLTQTATRTIDTHMPNVDRIVPLTFENLKRANIRS